MDVRNAAAEAAWDWAACNLMAATLSSDQIREFDALAAQQFDLPGRVLMENAGRGVAECIARLAEPAATILILCGKGNNGGDGFVAARHLEGRGYQVRVVGVAGADAYRGDARANLKALAHSDALIEFVTPENADELMAKALNEVDWVVDALLGIGVSGNPRSPLDTMIRMANAPPDVRRLAVDVPSGLDADSGLPGSPTFEAEITCTMIAVKPGLLVAAARPFAGRVEVVDLGVPRALLRRFGLG